MASLYRPVAIHPALHPYVHGIFIQEAFADPVQAEQSYTVFPSSYPVLGFQSRGRLHVIRGGGEERLAVSGITGLQGTARTSRASADTRTILVAFKSYGAFHLLACPMDRLADGHVDLDQIVGGPVFGCRRAASPHVVSLQDGPSALRGHRRDTQMPQGVMRRGNTMGSGSIPRPFMSTHACRLSRSGCSQNGQVIRRERHRAL